MAMGSTEGLPKPREIMSGQRGAFSAMRRISAAPQSRPWSARPLADAPTCGSSGRRLLVEVVATSLVGETVNKGEKILDRGIPVRITRCYMGCAWPSPSDKRPWVLPSPDSEDCRPRFLVVVYLSRRE
jgi:hypothetical protein